MGNIILDSLILFLLIYALLDIFTRIADHFAAKVLTKNVPAAYHVIFLDTTAENLEYGLRRTVQTVMDIKNCEVLIVDMNLNEESKEILERLCLEYDRIHRYTKEQYIDFIQNNDLRFIKTAWDTSLEHK